MKTFIFALCLLALLGCKKQSVTPSTWISGKWKITAVYNDTTANKQNIDVAAYPDELTFKTNNQVFSYGSQTTFTYSLADMTINESGRVFHIKQTSATTMTLTYYGLAPNFEMLTKE